MKLNDLPERWKRRLDNYRQNELKSKYPNLSAGDFRQDVKIEFPDGSTAFFHGAFFLADEALNEVAVFTEHCGYHIFPLYETKLELIG